MDASELEQLGVRPPVQRQGHVAPERVLLAFPASAAEFTPRLLASAGSNVNIMP